MKKYLLRLLVLALFAFATPAVWAQVTTSAINGTITDPTTKETLIGASVVAKHLPTGTTYGAITNAKGNFSIVGMRPGVPTPSLSPISDISLRDRERQPRSR